MCLQMYQQHTCQQLVVKPPLPEDYSGPPPPGTKREPCGLPIADGKYLAGIYTEGAPCPCISDPGIKPCPATAMMGRLDWRFVQQRGAQSGICPANNTFEIKFMPVPDPERRICKFHNEQYQQDQNVNAARAAEDREHWEQIQRWEAAKLKDERQRLAQEENMKIMPERMKIKSANPFSGVSLVDARINPFQGQSFRDSRTSLAEQEAQGRKDAERGLRRVHKLRATTQATQAKPIPRPESRAASESVSPLNADISPYTGPVWNPNATPPSRSGSIPPSRSPTFSYTGPVWKPNSTPPSRSGTLVPSSRSHEREISPYTGQVWVPSYPSSTPPRESGTRGPSTPRPSPGNTPSNTVTYAVAADRRRPPRRT